jgi:hypothetical protein
MKTDRLTPMLCALLSAAILFSQPSTRGQSTQRADLSGKYSYSHEFGGSSITLAPDGSYTAVAVDCTQNYTFTGSYVVNDGLIVLTPKSGVRRDNGGANEETIFPAKDGAAGAGVERYVAIRWGERLYLVGDDEVLAFCNAANLGVEPRKDIWKDAEYMFAYRGAYFGTFHLRAGDEDRPATGLPEVPDKWKPYVLKKPVAGKVVSLGEGKTATINLGGKQGMKVGMVLAVDGDDAPSIWGGLEIVSVGETTSVVKVRDEVVIGKAVSTRYYPKKFE